MDEKTNVRLRLFMCIAALVLPVIISDLFWINGNLSPQQEQNIGIVGGVVVGASFIWFVVRWVNRRRTPSDHL